MDLLNNIMNKMNSDLVNQIDDIIIEGLRIKGYKFENPIDLHEFIKNNCECIDNQAIKQKIYSVNHEPFLLHNYEIKVDFDYTKNNKISASMGTYAYL